MNNYIKSKAIPYGRQDNNPQRCPCLIPGTCEYVILLRRGDFTDVIKIRYAVANFKNKAMRL